MDGAGVVDIQQIRELLQLMDEHDLTEIKIRQGDTAIALRRGTGGNTVTVTPPAAPATVVATGVPVAGTGMPTPAAEDEGLTTIRSPMVGTFYATPDPEAPPFVTIGSEVAENTTVCVIEAMKVFNEIRAEVAGTIERILVHNEQAVEFGQPLMLVRPRR